MSALEETADLIDNAADLIEERGWVQGVGVNERGQMCVIGGLSRASDTYHRYNSAAYARAVTWIKSAIDKKYGFGGFDSIPVWNDQGGRTKQEVLDLLRETAKEVRSYADAL